ncbi:MAG: ATP-binding cassette domain-containing protein [Acidobacteriaceae bacterium]|nr:ATP-binding cassette domain-containing protein [Acidobacteriaceae bacterium]
MQTSQMDCGPAALKCLLEGFGIRAGYGRLREACQTGIDGTSIDAMETVANQLGLVAEQIMIPADHIFLPESRSLPAIVVVRLPNGMTHFVVIWRRHGNLLQVMDASVGRRWVRAAHFASEIYSHTMAVPALDWRQFAGSDEFQGTLRRRLLRLRISTNDAQRLSDAALEDPGWHGLAALDASTRAVSALVRAGAIRAGRECFRLVRQFCQNPTAIPRQYWCVAAVPNSNPAESDEQLFFRGAVLVRVSGKNPARSADHQLGPELHAALTEPPIRPAREVLRYLRASGTAAIVALASATAVAAGSVVLEAVLFRALFDISSELRVAGQRMGAVAALIAFSCAVWLLEFSILSAIVRLGRQLENRLRTAFLAKIPLLGDRYFQSRLSSDMAERSHATHRVRQLPLLVRQLLSAGFKLFATAAALIWLEPSAWPLILLIVASALAPPFAAQSILAERDLRVRSHAAALTRFYLDAMLGVLAIRAHGAERSVRREHDRLLGEWGSAALLLQKAVVKLEALQGIAMFGFVAWLLLSNAFQAADIGRMLLVVYWALNLPVLGQEIAGIARRYPYYRNLTVRVLEPLGAPEEQHSSDSHQQVQVGQQAPRIQFRNVSVTVSGHTILEDINLDIEAATHVAIVGPSGAGKSSLAGVLLGWLKPSSGDVLVDGSKLDPEALRASTAWVDPAVHIWNRSLLSNVCYGSQADSFEAADAIETALLRNVVETLPGGLQTALGEGGGLVSGGEGQRVRFARALLRRDARLVILDEPFRGLDREKRRESLSRARQAWKNATLVCITHDIEETKQFDRVIVVENGTVVADGDPKALSLRKNSRYADLLRAERETRSRLWSGNMWRRVRVQSGRILEQTCEPAREQELQSEVA